MAAVPSWSTPMRPRPYKWRNRKLARAWLSKYSWCKEQPFQPGILTSEFLPKRKTPPSHGGASVTLGFCHWRLTESWVPCANKRGRDFFFFFNFCGHWERQEYIPAPFKTNRLIYSKRLSRFFSLPALHSSQLSAAGMGENGSLSLRPQDDFVFTSLASPLAHLKPTGKQPEWRWTWDGPSHREVWRSCLMFLRQAGQDDSD